MKRLYAPWRHEYINKLPKDTVNIKTGSDECVFCKQVAAGTDDKFFILKRLNHCFVMMNLYPYSVGHIMVLPYDHHGELTDLASDVRAEMMDGVTLATQVMTEVLNAKGFNIGINLGIAGGGGIPSHVHIHVLPRWRGDTNFLETIGQVKLLSGDFEKTFQALKAGFERF